MSDPHPIKYISFYTGEFGLWFHNLFDTTIAEPEPTGCELMIAEAPNFRARARNRGACPCTSEQAMADRRWLSLESEIDNDPLVYFHTRRTFPLPSEGFGHTPRRVRKVSLLKKSILDIVVQQNITNMQGYAILV